MIRPRLFIVAFVLGLIGLANAQAADPVAVPKTPASENPCIKYLPDDAWLVGNADVRSILKWAAESKLVFAQRELVRQYAGMIELVSGVDPAKEIDYVTLFLAGSPEKDPAMLLVINGGFTTATVERKISEQVEADIEKIDTKNMYSVGTVSFAFPEAGTMVIGKTELVKAAIGKAKAKVNTPKLLADTLSRTDGGGLAWVAVRPKVVLEHSMLADFKKDNPELAKRLAAMEFVSLSAAEVADGYVVTASAAMEKKEEAQALHAYLATRKAALLEKEGVNAFYLPLLVASDIETADVHVRATTKLTMGTLKSLWDLRVVKK